MVDGAPIGAFFDRVVIVLARFALRRTAHHFAARVHADPPVDLPRQRPGGRDQVLRRDAQDSTVVEFRTAAAGVVTVDSSALDLEQTVLAVLKVVKAWQGRTS